LEAANTPDLHSIGGGLNRLPPFFLFGPHLAAWQVLQRPFRFLLQDSASARDATTRGEELKGDGEVQQVEKERR
jgi:hypothetical protein